MRFADWGKGYSLKWRSSYWTRLLLSSLLIVLSLLFLFPGSAQAAPAIFPAVLPSAQVNVAYSVTLVAAPLIPPPLIWAVISGSLPPGLTLAAATGVISGTPTTAGTYTFFVTVTDSTGPSPQQGFSITVAAKPLDFLYDYLADATEADSYQAYTGVTGGISPYTFSLVNGTLPSGLSLNSTSGLISGTPAKGTAGTFSFTIRVTDSSSPSLYAEQTYTLVVEKGYYDSVITISSTLAAGEANVYVDGKQVAKLGGGQTTRQSFAMGTEPDITVDPVVSHPTRTDVRFVADVTATTVNELSTDVTFTYHPEYFINLTTDPPQVASLTGSNWYKEGVTLRSTASAQIEGTTTGTQHRFSYWLLPTGEKSTDEDLSWIVTTAGKAIATYDTYYQLTVTSSQSKVTGSGWYKAGTAAQWSLNPPEVSMSGIFGLFLGKLKPDNATGTEVMDAPKTVTVTWHSDYTMPAVLLSLLFIILIVAIFVIRRLLYPPPPKLAVAPTPQAPTPPTIVVVGGAQRPDLQTTREQLVEKFGELLQKYENEVKAVVKAELPEAQLIPESQRLAAPKRRTTCGHTSKNLIRTVAGDWRKAEEKIQTKAPSKRKAAEKGISLVTVWARDIYNEWEIFTCSLPSGHSGGHKGTTRIAYSLQSTITEERTYGAKEKVTPPKPHFTDELPLVDIARHEVIAEESTSTSDVDTPYDVVPPEEE